MFYCYRPNSTIHLDFEEFATECNWDNLYIYDGKSVESPLIAVIRYMLVRFVLRVLHIICKIMYTGLYIIAGSRQFAGFSAMFRRLLSLLH